jgi:hypothetical protein
MNGQPIASHDELVTAIRARAIAVDIAISRFFLVLAPRQKLLRIAIGKSRHLIETPLPSDSTANDLLVFVAQQVYFRFCRRSG